MHSEDNSTINVVTHDVDEDLKRIIVPKSVWKKFDCYTLSSFTDYLDTSTKTKKVKDLKTDNIVSFRPEFNIDVKTAEIVYKSRKGVANEKREN